MWRARSAGAAIDGGSALGLLTMMNRGLVARKPGYGVGGRRGAAGMAALLLVIGAQSAAARHIPYPAIPDTPIVTSRHAPPRIVYPKLPADERVTPDDFVYDDDAEDLPSAAQQAALIDRLKLAQLSQNYRPHPAIWRIADHDTTLYLFGTIHVLPPGFEWRDAAVDRIAAEAQTLIVEAVDDGVAGNGLTAIDLLTGAQRKGPRPPPLAARVSPSHRAALARFRAALPPQANSMMDALPTWIAAVAVSFVRDYRSGEIPGPGADDWFEENFRARGRPVEEIEDGAQVMATVDAIPEADQRRMLDRALDAPQLSRAEMRASIHAWARGEVGPGSALTVDLQSVTGSAALSAPLLTDRNQAWTGELIRRLRTGRGTILFAAGAGHFIGPGSVIDLLERRGIKVTRIQ